MLRRDCFDVRNDGEPGTLIMNVEENDKYRIIDFPEVGQLPNQFCIQLNANRQKLRDNTPINAFIFISKLDEDNTEPSLEAAKQFHSIFGQIGINIIND